MTKGLALRDSLWAGCQMRKHREVKAASCVLTPFHCGTLPMGEYCPRWGLVFPPRVKSLWKHPHRSTQNTVSWVTLNPQAQCKVRSSLTLHCFHLGQRSQLVSLLLNLVTDVRRIKKRMLGIEFLWREGQASQSPFAPYPQLWALSVRSERESRDRMDHTHWSLEIHLPSPSTCWD